MKNEQMQNKMKEALVEVILGIVEEWWFTGTSGAPKLEWYTESIFNEERLYKALGKEDARSVLAIWQRFVDVVQTVQTFRGTP